MSNEYLPDELHKHENISQQVKPNQFRNDNWEYCDKNEATWWSHHEARSKQNYSKKQMHSYDIIPEEHTLGDVSNSSKEIKEDTFRFYDKNYHQRFSQLKHQSNLQSINLTSRELTSQEYSPKLTPFPLKFKLCSSKFDYPSQDATLQSKNIFQHQAINSSKISEAELRRYKSLNLQQDANSLDFKEILYPANNNKMPKLLAQKIEKKQDRRYYELMTEQQQNKEDREVHEDKFKTVMNQIHVVPYLINQEIHTYAYSTPVAKNNKNNQIKMFTAEKNPENYQYSSKKKAEEHENQKMYYSNQKQKDINFDQNCEREDNSSKLKHNFTYHSNLTNRNVNKSQPKEVTTHSHSKKSRTNSIESKNKPIFNPTYLQTKQELRLDHKSQIDRENFDVSQVSKIFQRNNTLELPYLENSEELIGQYKDQPQNNSSIIFENTEILFCCGDTDRTIKKQQNLTGMKLIEQKSSKNKVFEQVNNRLDVNFEAIDTTNVNNYQRPKVTNLSCKINSLNMIKNHNQQYASQKKVQEEGTTHKKKGINLTNLPTPGHLKETKDEPLHWLQFN